MFLSKAILTLAASGALFGANPAMNQAHAANQTNVQDKVYLTQGTNVNSDEFNNMIEQYLNNMGWSTQTSPSQTTVKQPTQTITQKPAQQPTQTVTQKPAQQPTQTVTQKPVQQPTQTVAQKPVQQTTATQSTSTLSAFEQQVVNLTNQERAKNGLPALKVDATLSKMAHEKARDMSANNYFSHTSPTYGSPFDMMKQYGITYNYAGENIAMGQQTPQEVVNAWMNSQGHRENILNSNYNYIGVGYVSQGNYWVQDFIGK